MDPLLASIPLGVLSAIIAVLLLQGWPHGYRWSEDISCTEENRAGGPYIRSSSNDASTES